MSKRLITATLVLSAAALGACGHPYYPRCYPPFPTRTSQPSPPPAPLPPPPQPRL